MNLSSFRPFIHENFQWIPGVSKVIIHFAEFEVETSNVSSFGDFVGSCSTQYSVRELIYPLVFIISMSTSKKKLNHIVESHCDVRHGFGPIDPLN